MSRFFTNKTDPGKPVITSTEPYSTGTGDGYYIGYYKGSDDGYDKGFDDGYVDGYDIALKEVKDWAWKHFGLEKDSSLWKELEKE